MPVGLVFGSKKLGELVWPVHNHACIHAWVMMGGMVLVLVVVVVVVVKVSVCVGVAVGSWLQIQQEAAAAVAAAVASCGGW